MRDAVMGARDFLCHCWWAGLLQPLLYGSSTRSVLGTVLAEVTASAAD